MGSWKIYATVRKLLKSKILGLETIAVINLVIFIRSMWKLIARNGSHNFESNFQQPFSGT